MHKPNTSQPLFREDKSIGQPLFMILAIMAFLATLSLLAAKSSYSAAGHWKAQLSNTATVQIKPSDIVDPQKQADKARALLLELDSVSSIDILSSEQSRALLRPWLGDAPLPDDLPLPTLLDIALKQNQTINVKAAQDILVKAGIRADIDDHGRWTKNLTATARMAQTISVLALTLIIFAIIAACIFATRAALSARAKFMNILHQVGATPYYTARLFSQNFAKNSFKAGIIGALGAYILLFLLSFFSSDALTTNGFLPHMTVGLSELYWILIIPVGMAVLGAYTAWRTVFKTLIREMYP
jgi:cell division transport system permease protein